jgi:hypothetical protein
MDGLLRERIDRGLPWSTALRGSCYSKRKLLKRFNHHLQVPFDVQVERMCRRDEDVTGAIVDPAVAYDIHLSHTLRGRIQTDQRITTKLFFDSRAIWGKPQQYMGLSTVSPMVDNHESWENFTPFMFYRELTKQDTQGPKQHNQDLLESSLRRPVLLHGLSGIESTARSVDSHLVHTHLIVVADWPAIISLDPGVADASARDAMQKLCYCCEFSTEDKKGVWHRIEDPLRWWNRLSERRPGLLPFLKLVDLMYDAMHGCARYHSCAWSTAILISNHAQRGLIKQEMMKNFHKSDPNLNIGALKSYFKDRKHVDFCRRLQSTARGPLSRVRFHDGERVLSTSRLILILLESVETFYLYTWQLTTQRVTVDQLVDARNQYLSILAHAKHDLWPSVHYMTNHYFEDIKHLDPIVPRLWINEKEEAANQHHRRMGKATMQGSSIPESSLNSCQMLLRNCLVKKVIEIKNK